MVKDFKEFSTKHFFEIAFWTISFVLFIAYSYYIFSFKINFPIREDISAVFRSIDLFRQAKGIHNQWFLILISTEEYKQFIYKSLIFLDFSILKSIDISRLLIYGYVFYIIYIFGIFRISGIERNDLFYILPGVFLLSVPIAGFIDSAFSLNVFSISALFALGSFYFLLNKTRYSFLLAAVLAFVCLLNGRGGLAVFICGFGLLVSNREIRKIIIWFLTMSAGIVMYFFRQTELNYRFDLWSQPLEKLRFSVGMIGSVFGRHFNWSDPTSGPSNSLTISVLIGALILLSFFFIVLKNFKKIRSNKHLTLLSCLCIYLFFASISPVLRIEKIYLGGVLHQKYEPIVVNFYFSLFMLSFLLYRNYFIKSFYYILLLSFLMNIVRWAGNDDQIHQNKQRTLRLIETYQNGDEELFSATSGMGARAYRWIKTAEESGIYSSPDLGKLKNRFKSEVQEFE